jgi:anti-sigma factor RsiW
VTHLGQRLSALIDGELEASERERVLWHMTKCGSCRDEVAALRMLKRRIVNSVGEAPAVAGLTGRLMSQLMGMQSGEAVWPPPPPPGGWPAHGRSSQDSSAAERGSRPDQRATRFFLAGSVAIFLAGLGTAAVIAGGEPQAQAPAPPVTPSVDVLVAPHNPMSQGPAGRGLEMPPPWLRGGWSYSDIDVVSLPGQP